MMLFVQAYDAYPASPPAGGGGNSMMEIRDPEVYQRSA